MFSDNGFKEFSGKSEVYREWKRGVDKILREYPDKKLVVIECGAGVTVSISEKI